MTTPEIIGIVGTATVVIGNFSALVWSAAVISTNVKQLKENFVELRQTGTHLIAKFEDTLGTLADHGARIKNLEERDD